MLLVLQDSHCHNKAAVSSAWINICGTILAYGDKGHRYLGVDAQLQSQWSLQLLDMICGCSKKVSKTRPASQPDTGAFALKSLQ